jgi:TRAP-type C4-dicarboxylate transport system substrate-binding protein
MSNLLKALQKKIAKEKEWANLPPENKKELEEIMLKGVTEGRQKAEQRAQFYRKK